MNVSEYDLWSIRQEKRYINAVNLQEKLKLYCEGELLVLLLFNQ